MKLIEQSGLLEIDADPTMMTTVIRAAIARLQAGQSDQKQPTVAMHQPAGDSHD